MTTIDLEDVKSFRARADEFVRATLGPATGSPFGTRDVGTMEEELALVQRDRDVQRMFFDAGFAGVCVPKEYGGRV